MKLDKKDFAVKQFDIAECKVLTDAGNIIIEGYANTKGVADRYGDIPTVFPSIRNYVYEIKDYLKNPVMLIDHENSIDHVAGSFVVVREDEKGLFVRGIFSNSDFPLTKHARTVYAEGHAKAFSIGGYWYHENAVAPEQLTYAVICDISVVGIGADANALGTAYEKALRSLEYAKALMPGIADEEKTKLATAGLKFCCGDGCRKVQEETEQKENVMQALNELTKGSKIAEGILAKLNNGGQNNG